MSPEKTVKLCSKCQVMKVMHIYDRVCNSCFREILEVDNILAEERRREVQELIDLVTPISPAREASSPSVLPSLHHEVSQTNARSLEVIPTMPQSDTRIGAIPVRVSSRQRPVYRPTRPINRSYPQRRRRMSPVIDPLTRLVVPSSRIPRKIVPMNRPSTTQMAPIWVPISNMPSSTRMLPVPIAPNRTRRSRRIIPAVGHTSRMFPLWIPSTRTSQDSSPVVSPFAGPPTNVSPLREPSVPSQQPLYMALYPNDSSVEYAPDYGAIQNYIIPNAPQGDEVFWQGNEYVYQVPDDVEAHNRIEKWFRQRSVMPDYNIESDGNAQCTPLYVPVAEQQNQYIG